jgi:hypothetical protein
MILARTQSDTGIYVASVVIHTTGIILLLQYLLLRNPICPHCHQSLLPGPAELVAEGDAYRQGVLRPKLKSPTSERESPKSSDSDGYFTRESMQPSISGISPSENKQSTAGGWDVPRPASQATVIAIPRESRASMVSQTETARPPSNSSMGPASFNSEDRRRRIKIPQLFDRPISSHRRASRNADRPLSFPVRSDSDVPPSSKVMEAPEHRNSVPQLDSNDSSRQVPSTYVQPPNNSRPRTENLSPEQDTEIVEKRPATSRPPSLTPLVSPGVRPSTAPAYSHVSAAQGTNHTWRSLSRPLDPILESSDSPYVAHEHESQTPDDNTQNEVEREILHYLGDWNSVAVEDEAHTTVSIDDHLSTVTEDGSYRTATPGPTATFTEYRGFYVH